MRFFGRCGGWSKSKILRDGDFGVREIPCSLEVHRFGLTKLSTNRPRTMSSKNSRGGAKSTKHAAVGIYNRVLPIYPYALDDNAAEPHAFDYHKTSRTLLSNPQCTGVLDIPSKSVWVVNARDVAILWQRGFFGKGNLSRSEPTWLTRETNELKGSAAREIAFYTLLFNLAE